MIRGVVFDLDNTLFDRKATLRLVFPHLLAAVRAANALPDGVSGDDLAQAWYDADRRLCMYGWPVIHRHLIENGFLRPSFPFEAYRDAVLDAFGRGAVRFDYAAGVLEDVKRRGLLCGLLTNGFEELQRKKLKAIGLENAFDAILTPGPGENKKPHPEFFHRMAGLLACRPDELIYVGDDPFADVGGAYGAGYLPVWVKTSGIWPEGEKRAPYEIDDVSRLPALLDRLLS